MDTTMDFWTDDPPTPVPVNLEANEPDVTCPEQWPSTVHDGPHTCVWTRGHGGMHKCQCSWSTVPEYSLRSLSGAFGLAVRPGETRLQDVVARAVSDLQQVGQLPGNIQVLDSVAHLNTANELTVRVSWELKP